MMIVMKPTATEEQVQAVIARIESCGARAHPSRGEEVTIIGAIGDREHVARLGLEGHEGVEQVVPILKPFKLSSAQLKPGDRTIIEVDGRRIGGDHFSLIAGPCTVESRDQTLTAARMVAAGGASLFRGGAYKPRSSPYSFQGLGQEGLRLLAEAKAETGLPIVTELMDARDLEPVAEVADVIQLGARNMQNYALLAEVGPRGPAGAAQARAVGDARGAADGRGVHPQGGQPERAAVRARDPDVRDRLPVHARPDRDPGAQGALAPAGDRRSQPRRRPPLARRAAVAGRRGGGRGRDHRRGASRSPTRRSATARSSCAPTASPSTPRRSSAPRRSPARCSRTRLREADAPAIRDHRRVRIAIVGVGLIGGSVGLAARERLGAEVTGWDPAPGVLDAALEVGAIDRAAPDAGRGARRRRGGVRRRARRRAPRHRARRAGRRGGRLRRDRRRLDQAHRGRLGRRRALHRRAPARRRRQRRRAPRARRAVRRRHLVPDADADHARHALRAAAPAAVGARRAARGARRRHARPHARHGLPPAARAGQRARRAGRARADRGGRAAPRDRPELPRHHARGRLEHRDLARHLPRQRGRADRRDRRRGAAAERRARVARRRRRRGDRRLERRRPRRPPPAAGGRARRRRADRAARVGAEPAGRRRRGRARARQGVDQHRRHGAVSGAGPLVRLHRAVDRRRRSGRRRPRRSSPRSASRWRAHEPALLARRRDPRHARAAAGQVALAPRRAARGDELGARAGDELPRRRRHALVARRRAGARRARRRPATAS